MFDESMSEEMDFGASRSAGTHNQLGLGYADDDTADCLDVSPTRGSLVRILAGASDVTAGCGLLSPLLARLSKGTSFVTVPGKGRKGDGGE
jgi:hypothetical protein